MASTTTTTVEDTLHNNNNDNDNNNNNNANEDETVYDLLVIGGGVVGLAVCRAAAVSSSANKICLVERESHLLHWASGSNSGIACTGVDAAVGTLERALVRDGLAQLRHFGRSMNVPLRPCGSLVCEWESQTKPSASNATEQAAAAAATSTEHQPPKQNEQTEDDNTVGAPTHPHHDALHDVLMESWDAGDSNVRRLSPEQVRTLEPHLNHHDCRGAVHIAGEVVLDPWLHSVALAVHARQNGARIYTNFDVDPVASSLDADAEVWTIVPKTAHDTTPGHDPAAAMAKSSLRAKAVVSATGVWADAIQRDLFAGTPAAPQWSARPRRGQYKVYAPLRPDHDQTAAVASSNSTTRPLLTHPIQPIPTQRTKGIFVFSTLYDQIVVGPTATDQDSRTDRTLWEDTAEELDQVAKRTVPDLARRTRPVGAYVGIRPGTNRRDYQIHTSVAQRWVVVAGIRSTGLTASLGIGRHVVQLLQSTGLCAWPARSGDGSPDEEVDTTVCTRPLPPANVLAKLYRESGAEESVMIDGYMYKVTHPLTRLGFAAGTGIAADDDESEP